MFGIKSYNYDAFTKDLLVKDVALDRFSGPDPGDTAPDFEARTLNGDRVRLSDYEGEKNVVLTFGSATCPFTAASQAIRQSASRPASGWQVALTDATSLGSPAPLHAVLIRDLEQETDAPVLSVSIRANPWLVFGTRNCSTLLLLLPSSSTRAAPQVHARSAAVRSARRSARTRSALLCRRQTPLAR